METQGLHLCIIHRPLAAPDEAVAATLERGLAEAGHRVSLDRRAGRPGLDWAHELETMLRTPRVVIVILSAASAASEMLAYEAEVAHEAALEGGGWPRLLAVRAAWDGPLPGALAAILGTRPVLHWRGPADNAALLAAVLGQVDQAARHEPLHLVRSPGRPRPVVPVPPQRPVPSPGPFPPEPAGGAVPLASPFYITRPADEEMGRALRRNDFILLAKGPRQSGKTSLLVRAAQRAAERGAKVAWTDLQKLNAAELGSIEAFYQALTGSLADELGLNVDPAAAWKEDRTPNNNLERLLETEILQRLNAPVFWVVDEVDLLLGCPFRGDWFSLVRGWHEERRRQHPGGRWVGLALAWGHSVEPQQFITNPDQSPFNVGIKLNLHDFDDAMVEDLNSRNAGPPLKDAAERGRFMDLVGGHPFLVWQGLYELAVRHLDLAALEATADRDDGPFGDHLRRLLLLLARDEALAEAVRGLLRGRSRLPEDVFYRLRSAGLLGGESSLSAEFRCGLYRRYLARHLA